MKLPLLPLPQELLVSEQQATLADALSVSVLARTKWHHLQVFAPDVDTHHHAYGRARDRCRSA